MIYGIGLRSTNDTWIHSYRPKLKMLKFTLSLLRNNHHDNFKTTMHNYVHCYKNLCWFCQNPKTMLESSFICSLTAFTCVKMSQYQAVSDTLLQSEVSSCDNHVTLCHSFKKRGSKPADRS